MKKRELFPTQKMYEDFVRFSKLDETEYQAYEEADFERLKAMSPEEREQDIKDLSQGVEMAVEFAKQEMSELALYKKLGDVSKYVSLSQVATDYFGKTKQWLYQRLKNYNVNNKPATFTSDEKEQFRQALLDISRKIREAALNL